MTSARTHRDIYRAAIEIARRHGPAARGLEAWLRALLGLLPRVAGLAELTVDDLLGLLDAAFIAPPAQFDPEWSQLPPVTARERATADDVTRTLQRQIWELHELARSHPRGDRSGGIAVLGGGQWFADDPASFIEAGLQGALGGYGLDDSSRSMVTGAELRNQLGAGASGEIVVRAIPMTHVTWDDLHSLLVCGQSYL
ncbi:MAG: hypothetical protein IAG13_27775 [Deltaproteobacteria bacterium]|nr:hypothetical protein [Nannocystaceae bacterium]